MTTDPLISGQQPPLPVQYALSALEQLRQENPSLADEVAGILPGYALKESRAGNSVTVDTLLAIARMGKEILKNTTPLPHTKAEPTHEDPLSSYWRIVDEGIDPYKELPAQCMLELACKKGDVGRVKTAIKRGARIVIGIDKSGHNSNETLCAAALGGHLDVVKYVVEEYGADISDNDYYVLSPAAKGGHLHIVKYLIEEQGADIFTQALSFAAESGHLHVVKYLIEEQGADISAPCCYALGRAAQFGHLHVVKYLVEEHGADISANNYWALSSAARGGRLHVVKYLIEEQGVDDIPILDLNEIAEKEHYNIVKYLAEERGFLLPDQYVNHLADYNKGLIRWKKTVHCDPPQGLHKKNPAFFKGAAFELANRILQHEECTLFIANKMAFSAAALFGTVQRMMDYLERWHKSGHQPFHDLVYMINISENAKGHHDINLKDWGDAVLKCGPSMAKLVKFANKEMPSPAKSADGKTWSMVRTRAEIAKYAFEKAAENPALAALCLEHDVDENAFNTALRLIQEKKTKIEVDLPDITLDGTQFGLDSVRFYHLPAHDVRGLFLGEMTDCCQSIGGQGADCATHGFTSSHGGFYVVEDAKEKIIGQSWAWRGTRGEMCMDSLETLGDRVTPEQWISILDHFAQALQKRNDHDISALHVGIGGGTPKEALRRHFAYEAEAKPKDYTGYRDSEGPQIVVWKNKMARRIK